jgi:hypothetical protein
VKFGYRSDMKVEKNLTILLYFDHHLKPVVEIWFSVGRDRIWQVVVNFHFMSKWATPDKLASP